MPREVLDHRSAPAGDAQDNYRVEAVDDPGPGGASFKYEVTVRSHGEWARHAAVKFQSGPLDATSGPNGLTNEVLLAVVLDRLRGFQQGPFACRENALAITNLEQTLHWLGSRSRDRNLRGVANKMEK